VNNFPKTHPSKNPSTPTPARRLVAAAQDVAEPADRSIVLPKVSAMRKRRYLKAAERRRLPLAEWVFAACDAACAGGSQAAGQPQKADGRFAPQVEELKQRLEAAEASLARAEAGEVDWVGGV
jgi:hypothetical protein